LIIIVMVMIKSKIKGDFIMMVMRKNIVRPCY